MRTRIAGAMVLGFGAIVLVGAILDAQSQARLVSLEPNNTPTDVAMMRFALPRGRGLYQAHCASCHGVEGRGRPAIGAPNLTDNDWLYGEGQVSDIETVVQYGIRAPNGRTWRLADMPAFAHRVPYPRETALQPLTPGDIRDVVQFLDILRQQPADPAAALRGQAIFGNRGGCYDCHGRDGRGDAAIGAPNLTDSIWLYGDGSDAWIADTIANGLAGTCPAWFDRLSPAQIREISLYVYSLSHSGEQPKQSVP
ncbi:MAG TPA: c-type cytochrome [Caulobacteraceae bacterium]|nr:c-type cytochrome [Caulobacteraceae bacterium]